MLTSLSFVLGLLIVPIVLKLAKVFGLYAVVGECEAQVFTLFGKVLGVLDEPGLRFPMARFGPRAFLIPFFGKRHIVSTALRQHNVVSNASASLLVTSGSRVGSPRSACPE